MKKNDFLVCSFKGDNATYVAEITRTDDGTFDCRFVHSDKLYSFSRSNWTVKQSNGGFPAGTPLTNHQVFTLADEAPALNNPVRVTFNNGKVYLGILMNEDPLTVTFLHGSRPTYVFEDNVIKISGGAYKVGDTIREVKRFRSESAAEATTTTVFQPAGAPQKTISAYDPASAETLVCNATEFDGIPGLKNYKGWPSDKNIPHNRKPKKIRTAASIIHITLHESGADNGDGFYDANDTTSHFSVLKNNAVLQFNDILEKQYHIGPFNDTAIGIEFVNSGWVQGMPSKESAMDAGKRSKFAEEKGYLWCFCGLGQNVYKLPPVQQLEKLTELLNRFFTASEPDLPRIQKDWPQIVSYNDVKDTWNFPAARIPAAGDESDRRYLIFSNGDLWFTPQQIAGKSGIFSHACVNSIHNGKPDPHAHPDGSFLALYTWLRFIKQKTSDQAYLVAKQLIKNHNFIVKTKQKFPNRQGENEPKMIILIDVSDANISS